MSNKECRPQSKCGYCGWLMFGTRFKQHECFAAFNERENVIVVDDNGIITMNTVTNPNVQDESQHELVEDEILIDVVLLRKPLWDHTVAVTERTKLKKDALWIEISNIMGGRKIPEELKKRWQYLRDCFGKAKKKMQTYVPSGSGGGAGNPTHSTFRYYDRMQFLQQTLRPQDTVDSLPETIRPTETESQPSCSYAETEPECETPSRPSTPSTTMIRPRSSSSSSTLKKSRKRFADTSELESEFLKYFKEATPKRDATDSFLEQLGDILRRLPYINRRHLQMRILTEAINEEDQVLAMDDN